MIKLKPARRHAFRIGMQVAELQKGGRDDAAKKVEAAFGAFLGQFDDDHVIIRDFLINEYELGLGGRLPLSGFVENHDGTFTKTYSVAAA